MIDILDATLFLNNTETLPGMNRIKQIGGNLLHTDWPAAQAAAYPLPDLDEIDMLAVSLTDPYCYLDVEYLDLDPTSSKFDDSIEYFRFAMSAFKYLRPDVQFGYYGEFPERMYWGTDRYQRWTQPNNLLSWQKRNDAKIPLSSYSDIIFPSIYTFYDDQDGWEEYAAFNIMEARKAGKPVYPFIWFQYHDSHATLGKTFIPGDYWRRQLELCAKLADGIVIWGGWDDENGVRMTFDPTQEWWQETVDFMLEQQG